MLCYSGPPRACRAEETTGSQGPKLPGLGISHQDMLATLKQAVGAVALIGGFAGGSLALMQVSDGTCGLQHEVSPAMHPEQRAVSDASCLLRVAFLAQPCGTTRPSTTASS